MFTIRAPRLAVAVSGALAVSFSSSLAAQSHFASQVVSANTNGGAGGGVFNPGNALGAPAGATHVHSLGVLGDLTLGFQPAITNGPGADLLVGENPFRLSPAFHVVFAEVAFVEVSSDGTHFARFPSRYFGGASGGAFSTAPAGSYSGLAGQHPVLATTPNVDARDVVDAGGDAFDLADLAGDPLVLGGQVDLNAISQVRLVDVQSGVSLDSSGTPIVDPTAGSADIDHVTAIHQVGSVANGNPNVELSIQIDGTMSLRLEDPDGWSDIDFTSLRAALFGLPVDAFGLLTAFQVQSFDANGFTLVQPVPLPPGLLFTMSVSLKDHAGNRSGASRARPTS